MDKEKIITLIEMLEREIEEISAMSKVGHRVISAIHLLNCIKQAVHDDKPIDLEEVRTQLEIFENAKKKSEKEVYEMIQNVDSETLNQMAFIQAMEIIQQSENDDEPISKEDFKQLKEYYLFLLKNGLVGKSIQTVEYNGYLAEQFQNFKVLFTKENGEMAFCNYYKKATKQELKKFIDDIKAGKTRSKV